MAWRREASSEWAHLAVTCICLWPARSLTISAHRVPWYALRMLLPPTSDNIERDETTPFFLWWNDATVADSRRHLSSTDVAEHGYWLGALLREANSRDVWRFTTPAQLS